MEYVLKDEEHGALVQKAEALESELDDTKAQLEADEGTHADLKQVHEEHKQATASLLEQHEEDLTRLQMALEKVESESASHAEKAKEQSAKEWHDSCRSSVLASAAGRTKLQNRCRQSASE